MAALNRDQPVVAWVLEAVRTGINLDEVEPRITEATRAMQALDAAMAGGDLAAIEAAARVAEAPVNAASAAIHEYRERQIGAGESTITALEVTSTACFTIFALAGGAVLAAPVAAGGLGMGAVSSSAVMGGATALLTSAAGVGAKAVQGDEVGWADVRTMTIETVVGAAGGAVGAGVAARVAPFVSSALVRTILANDLIPGASEEALTAAVRAVVSGSAAGAVQGAIGDAVRVLRGQATMEQLVRNVVVNLVAGGVVGLVGSRLAPGSATEPPATARPGGETTEGAAEPYDHTRTDAMRDPANPEQAPVVKLRRMALEHLGDGGPNGPVKVVPLSYDVRPSVSGDFTQAKFVAGRTPQQLADELGVTAFKDGVRVYRLDRAAITEDNLNLRGYTQSPAGKSPSLSTPENLEKWPVGQGAPQWNVSESVPADHVGDFPPGAPVRF
jgi:hypothetical protein